jgi:pyrroline-5-carboxylate reductase
MTVLSTLNPKLPSYEDDRRVLLSIFSAVGRCRFLDEKHFDACTALAGSGPAFACVFLEAMADGGVMMGLPRKEALELAAQCECVRRSGRAVADRTHSDAGRSTHGAAVRHAPGRDQGQRHE